jgi:hypothetical protein
MMGGMIGSRPSSAGIAFGSSVDPLPVFPASGVPGALLPAVPAPVLGAVGGATVPVPLGGEAGVVVTGGGMVVGGTTLAPGIGR